MTIDGKELKEGAILSHFSAASLARIAARSEERRYEPGDRIFSEGDPAESIFILRTGYIAIEVDLGLGRHAHVSTISAGEDFGWSALVPPRRMTASARAVEPSTVVVVPAPAVEEAMKSEPGSGIEAMRGLARIIELRLRDTRLQIANLLEWPGAASAAPGAGAPRA